MDIINLNSSNSLRAKEVQSSPKILHSIAIKKQLPLKIPFSFMCTQNSTLICNQNAITSENPIESYVYLSLDEQPLNLI